MSTFLNSFGWCEDLVQAISVLDPDFPSYLINQSQAERQYLVMVLLGWEQRDPKVCSLPDLAEKLRTENRKALLREFFQPYPRGLIAVLNKLGRRVLAKNRYLDLIDLLTEPSATKVLCHSTKIGPFTIKALNRLDPSFRRPAILGALHNQAVLDHLIYAVAVAQHLDPTASEGQLATSLERSISQSHETDDPWLVDHSGIENWLNRRLQKVSFPDPPWPGTAKLRPIGSAKDLIRLGRQFDNCLKDKIPTVIGGQRCFYLWSGSAKAVVALDHDLLLSWVVGEMKGPNNKQVSKKVKAEILNEFGIAGLKESPRPEEVDYAW